MADPRMSQPNMRRANHSPLMAALSKKGHGETVNFCPFGCQDHELDENGACGHLVGFYDKGTTYEPRIVNKKTKRIITSGQARKPMEKGFKLVKITTTARVYSPEPNKNLVVQRDNAEQIMAEINEKERVLLEAAERVRNPVLEGEWGQSEYDAFTQVAAAATSQ